MNEFKSLSVKCTSCNVTNGDGGGGGGCLRSHQQLSSYYLIFISILYAMIAYVYTCMLVLSPVL